MFLFLNFLFSSPDLPSFLLPPLPWRIIEAVMYFAIDKADFLSSSFIEFPESWYDFISQDSHLYTLSSSLLGYRETVNFAHLGGQEASLLIIFVNSNIFPLIRSDFIQVSSADNG